MHAKCTQEYANARSMFKVNWPGNLKARVYIWGGETLNIPCRHSHARTMAEMVARQHAQTQQVVIPRFAGWIAYQLVHRRAQAKCCVHISAGCNQRFDFSTFHLENNLFAFRRV